MTTKLDLRQIDSPEDELEAELVAFRTRVENDTFLPERLKEMWRTQNENA